MSSVVVPDACVLIPASLRDTIFRASVAGIYKLQLTDEIMEEVRRNLVAKISVPEDKAQRLVSVVKAEFDHCFVVPHKRLINSMPINKKDRHVLAAAVCGKAHIILTQNLKDFPSNVLARYQVVAQSPDEFLINLLRSDKERIANVLVKQAGSLRNPSMTVLELLDHLRVHAPIFTRLAREEFTQHGSGTEAQILDARTDAL